MILFILLACAELPSPLVHVVCTNAEDSIVIDTQCPAADVGIDITVPTTYSDDKRRYVVDYDQPTVTRFACYDGGFWTSGPRQAVDTLGRCVITPNADTDAQ